MAKQKVAQWKITTNEQVRHLVRKKQQQMSWLENIPTIDELGTTLFLAEVGDAVAKQEALLMNQIAHASEKSKIRILAACIFVVICMMLLTI